jgi:hypothetical protein
MTKILEYIDKNSDETQRLVALKYQLELLKKKAQAFG